MPGTHPDQRNLVSGIGSFYKARWEILRLSKAENRWLTHVIVCVWGGGGKGYSCDQQKYLSSVVQVLLFLSCCSTPIG